MTRTLFETIVDSLENGQFKQAREQTLHRCKTKPIELAHRVGTVVEALTDPDGNRNQPDLAASFLRLFKE